MESPRSAHVAPRDAAPPLLGADAGLPVAWRGDGPIGRRHYLADVQAVAAQLPDSRYIVNACDDRYRFLVAFGAALTRSQTCLLPHNRTAHALDQITRHHEGACTIGDNDVRLTDVPPPGALEPPRIPRDHIAAIVFTSGSTGEPTPHAKCWGSLVEGAKLVRARYGVQPRPGTLLVATVAPQHMFGLEASVMLPLTSGVTVHAGRPFFPADLHAVLSGAPEYRVLVTTPYHLGVLLQSGLAWPRVELIISATAPMAQGLAARAEAAFGARVMEIFGSTESGAIASRRTAVEAEWTLYDGLHLRTVDSEHRVEGGHLPERIVLRDRLELSSQRTFTLLGRDEDLLKVGGKRCSLGDLNRALGQIEGVVDGVFIAPETGDTGVERLTALVVAPGQSGADLLQALARVVDSAFLPRPLHLVESLPRNDTGKLARKDLLELLARLGGGA
ncbi:MAG TPA: AMP-binding protein [bacterium]